ncbi:MAG TPA: STAS domain-containing protein [Solirubrobacteraceae bacterium]|nr:STAS domain-containing protein [Solirubrobacteraceae bacterium]
MGRLSAVRTQKENGSERSAADPARDVEAQSGPRERHLALADVDVRDWTHTLVLTGELDRRSARTLEAEIERLCREGVSGITLDLRGLTYIDSIGVAVIAFRCGHCRRRGCEFALVPGPASIQRAFERAGVRESLPFQHQ